jgi:hypothetical protein
MCNKSCILPDSTVARACAARGREKLFQFPRFIKLLTVLFGKLRIVNKRFFWAIYSGFNGAAVEGQRQGLSLIHI